MKTRLRIDTSFLWISITPSWSVHDIQLKLIYTKISVDLVTEEEASMPVHISCDSVHHGVIAALISGIKNTLSWTC